MRLPSKPNYGGVASLAKPSGRQEFAFAMQKSQQKTERTDAVLKIAQTAYKAHDDFSAQQSTSKHVSAMRDADKYLMDNPFLDPDDIGKDNVLSAREKLQAEGIKIVGECVGGSQGRSVEFSPTTGVVTVKIKF